MYELNGAINDFKFENTSSNKSLSWCQSDLAMLKNGLVGTQVGTFKNSSIYLSIIDGKILKTALQPITYKIRYIHEFFKNMNKLITLPHKNHYPPSKN